MEQNKDIVLYAVGDTLNSKLIYANLWGWNFALKDGKPVKDNYYSVGFDIVVPEITRTEIRIDQELNTQYLRATVKKRTIQRWNKKRRNR